MALDKIEEPPRPTPSDRRRALLIGIDYYDQFNDRENLHGCVSDVEAVQDALHQSGLIPKEHIRMLRGPIPHGKYPKPWAPIRPGRNEIIAAIQHINSQSNRGDFVYLHFSGHGTRQETVYQKRGTGKDEAMCCADGNIIRDVELGVLLDDMAARGITVLTVLDCCHSGGATRTSDDDDDGWRPRERAQKLVPQETAWMGLDTIDSTSSSQEGPAAKSEHWFWRDRPYHLIAACQPYELAREFLDADDRIHGLLTYYMIETLAFLGPMAFVTTYRNFIQLLQAKCKSQNLGRSQCPVMYGDLNRVIFDLAATPTNHTDYSTVTLVLRIELGQRAVLGRGSADGVSVGDVYRLSPLPNVDGELEVQIIEVDSFESLAKPKGFILEQSHEFWVASLVKSANEGHVVFEPLDFDSPALDCVKNEWTRYVDRAFPLQFHFNGNFDNAKFYVRLTESEFHFLDSEKNHLLHIPTVAADCRPGMTKRLSATLSHLYRFLKFDALEPEEEEELEPNWEFQVVQKPVPRKSSATARYRIAFTNNSPRRRLFISIFNIAPDWSITQIIPSPGYPGEPVEPGKSIEAFAISITVPPLLQKTKPEKMTDKLKILITTQEHDFSHYQIPDIEATGSESYRNARELIEGSFAVEERVLTHTINPPHAQESL
ncbi:Metacaspase-9 [Lasiodiplodia hormozganensis]|uniref:Metacaspase-9 n=1 Tax=Lasiodiplodia hormozganensis TaxID=869390 RepID=A0AA40CU30_9PEZI|nr:Metacaspase-9 [Lasiodiplodia hormozganensis]